MRAGVVALLWLCACQRVNPLAPGEKIDKPDLASDLGNEIDLANEVDLASEIDLASWNDMPTEYDLANDLASANDLATDLANANDLATDLANANDLASPAPIAWGAPCSAADACAAPVGELPFCNLFYGTPLCIHTCDSQVEASSCEEKRGLCIAAGPAQKVCVPRCDEQTGCGAGASCSFLGFRNDGSGYQRVGICAPDCAATGPDACKAAGRACDPVRRGCVPLDCGDCPSGSLCQNGACNPPSPLPAYASCTSNNLAQANGCASNLCFTNRAAPATGFCGRFCDSDDSSCGAGVCWTDNSRLRFSSGGTLAAPIGQLTVFGGRNAGACMKPCDDTRDCPDGWHCAEWNGKRACIPTALPRRKFLFQNGKPGDVCEDNFECESDACHHFAGYRNGVCQRASIDVACPAGTTASMENPLACVPQCNPNVDNSCPQPLACIMLEGCSPAPCRADADCADGFFCDVRSGACRDTPNDKPGSVGDPCDGDEDCGGFCIAGAIGGYCSSFCRILDERDDTCPDGALCIVTTVGTRGICIDLCDLGPLSRYGLCREGYTCTASPRDPRFGFCQ